MSSTSGSPKGLEMFKRSTELKAGGEDDPRDSHSPQGRRRARTLVIKKRTFKKSSKNEDGGVAPSSDEGDGSQFTSTTLKIPPFQAPPPPKPTGKVPQSPNAPPLQAKGKGATAPQVALMERLSELGDRLQAVEDQQKQGFSELEKERHRQAAIDSLQEHFGLSLQQAGVGGAPSISSVTSLSPRPSPRGFTPRSDTPRSNMSVEEIVVERLHDLEDRESTLESEFKRLSQEHNRLLALVQELQEQVNSVSNTPRGSASPSPVYNSRGASPQSVGSIGSRSPPPRATASTSTSNIPPPPPPPPSAANRSSSPVRKLGVLEDVDVAAARVIEQKSREKIMEDMIGAVQSRNEQLKQQVTDMQVILGSHKEGVKDDLHKEIKQRFDENTQKRLLSEIEYSAQQMQKQRERTQTPRGPPTTAVVTTKEALHKDLREELEKRGQSKTANLKASMHEELLTFTTNYNQILTDMKEQNEEKERLKQLSPREELHTELAAQARARQEAAQQELKTKREMETSAALKRDLHRELQQKRMATDRQKLHDELLDAAFKRNRHMQDIKSQMEAQPRGCEQSKLAKELDSYVSMQRSAMQQLIDIENEDREDDTIIVTNPQDKVRELERQVLELLQMMKFMMKSKTQLERDLESMKKSRGTTSPDADSEIQSLKEKVRKQQTENSQLRLNMLAARQELNAVFEVFKRQQTEFENHLESLQNSLQPSSSRGIPPPPPPPRELYGSSQLYNDDSYDGVPPQPITPPPPGLFNELVQAGKRQAAQALERKLQQSQYHHPDFNALKEELVREASKRNSPRNEDTQAASMRALREELIQEANRKAAAAYERKLRQQQYKPATELHADIVQAGKRRTAQSYEQKLQQQQKRDLSALHNELLQQANRREEESAREQREATLQFLHEELMAKGLERQQIQEARAAAKADMDRRLKEEIEAAGKRNLAKSYEKQLQSNQRPSLDALHQELRTKTEAYTPSRTYSTSSSQSQEVEELREKVEYLSKMLQNYTRSP